MSSLLYCRPSDIITDQATLSLFVGTINANFPLANLSDRNPAKTTKTTGTTATIRATFPVPVALEMASFGPHNFAGATSVTLTNNSGLSQAFTVPANREDGLSVGPWLDLTGILLATRTASQWNLVIVGALANIALGEWPLITTKRTMRINWAYKEGESHPTVGPPPTDYGVKLRKWLGCAQRRLLGHLEFESERAALLSLARDARGQTKGFLLVPDSDVNDAFLADLTTDERLITREYFAISQVDVEFLEVQRGPAL